MYLFITILIMEILVGAEIDLFVPSFPEIQTIFNISTFEVELLLGINFIGHCITSLIVGNLGDRFGRKAIIIIGLIIFVIGSISCAFAMDYYVLLLGRLLQGIGIAGIAVLGYVVIADIYSAEQQQQMLGILNGAITLGMAFAPVIGSYVSFLLGWRGNFSILLALGLVCLVLGILFIPKSQVNYNVKISLREYNVIFKSKKTIYYLIIAVFILQSYWVFIAISPIYYMRDLGVPIQQFGFYQGVMAAVCCIGNFSSSYFLKRFGQKKCFFFGVVMLSVFIISAMILLIYKINDPLIITIVIQLIAIGVIFPCNILWPLMLETIPNAKGRITAVAMSGRFIVTAICVQLISYFHHGTFLPLAIVMCTTIIITLITCYKLLQEYKILN